MKKMIRIVLRHVNETEDWLKVAEQYCAFKYGRDQRGRGHGSTPSQLKAIEKDIVKRFGSIENCRQWLAKQKKILVVSHGEHFELAVGYDENTFVNAIERAKIKTSLWRTEENICTFVGTMSAAQSYIKEHEAFIAGPYVLY